MWTSTTSRPHRYAPRVGAARGGGMQAFLSEVVKIEQAVTVTAGAAAATPVNGAIHDLNGYDGILIVVQFGPIVATAVTSIKLQQDTDPAGATMADLAGTAQTVPDNADDTVFYIDHKRGLERYVRLVVSRAVVAATVTAIAYLYKARRTPITQGAGISGERHATPIEGTA